MTTTEVWTTHNGTTVETLIDVEVPSAEVVLDYANRVRAAGGANALDALLPSVQSDSHQCLIANALNFQCAVHGLATIIPNDDWAGELNPAYKPTFKVENPTYDDGSAVWAMHFPVNMERERVEAVCKAMGEPLIDNPYRPSDSSPKYAMRIPAALRNAAVAFDRGQAFTDLAKNRTSKDYNYE